MQGDNKIGAAVVVSILAFYIGIISVLQIAANRNSAGTVTGDAGCTGETRVEMTGFTVTAYCPGSCCNGLWAGLTASGKSIEYYRRRMINIAAVDPMVISMGSNFLYQGTVYHAVDVGGKIKGRRIDILLSDHAAANAFGVKKSQSITIIDSKKKISRSDNKKSTEVL
jgi:3D (Asp-Asp-Asp) domain-containing protein